MTNDDAKLLASLTGFTPGPWGIDATSGLDGKHDVWKSWDEIVCENARHANATLIAAAPDLFRIATEQATKIEAQAKEISALRIERGHVNDALQDMCDKMARALGDPV